VHFVSASRLGVFRDALERFQGARKVAGGPARGAQPDERFVA
jgi:hypothetical protein